MIQNSRSVNDLPTQIFIISVADIKRLGGKSIRLNFHVCAGDLVNKAGFAYVWEARDEDGPRVGVDRGQTAQMLSYLKRQEAIL